MKLSNSETENQSKILILEYLGGIETDDSGNLLDTAPMILEYLGGIETAQVCTPLSGLFGDFRIPRRD